MLIPEFAGFRLDQLTDLSLSRDEEFEGELCYHIRGKHQGEPYDVWIGKRDWLLRKVRNESKYADYTSIQEEIHRHLSVNQPIAKDVFDFKPPIALSVPKDSKPDAGLGTLEESMKPEWSEFTSEEGRFKLLLPAKPNTQTLTMETGKGRIVHHGFVAIKGGFVCMVGFADLPKEFADSNNAKLLFDEARNEFLKEIQGKLASESAISLEGHPGREMKIHIYGGEAWARYYLIEGRFYQLAITRIDALSKSDDAVVKFFNSFKLIPNSKPIAGIRYELPRPDNSLLDTGLVPSESLSHSHLALAR